jgi:hypothetical protein
MAGTKEKSLCGVVGAVLLARVLQEFLPDLPVWVRLVLAASFWLPIVVVVPVILWHVFLVIKEYRGKKSSQSDAIDQSREVPVSAERRVDAPPARSQRPARLLSTNLVVVLTVAAAIVGVAVGWFGARSWDLPEMRLARNVEQAKRKYFECATAAERLFDTHAPSATRARTSVDTLAGGRAQARDYCAKRPRHNC